MSNFTKTTSNEWQGVFQIVQEDSGMRMPWLRGKAPVLDGRRSWLSRRLRAVPLDEAAYHAAIRMQAKEIEAATNHLHHVNACDVNNLAIKYSSPLKLSSNVIAASSGQCSMSYTCYCLVVA
jgi:hypothetical protein